MISRRNYTLLRTQTTLIQISQNLLFDEVMFHCASQHRLNLVQSDIYSISSFVPEKKFVSILLYDNNLRTAGCYKVSDATAKYQ